MNRSLRLARAYPDFAIRGEWKIVRLWDISRIRSERGHPYLRLLSVFLNRGVIPYGEGGGQVHKPGVDRSAYQVVRKGDFVLNNQQAWRGSVGVSKHEGIISPAYVVLALGSDLNPRFADYLFQSRDMVAQYVTASKGVGDIQRDIYLPWLKNVRVPVPPADEQSAIVRYLNWASGRLERAIRAKQKVIALLNEQRQVIVQRAATRGIDTSVPLKPTEIPWLGSIPQHWEVVRVGRLFSQVTRYTANGDEPKMSMSRHHGLVRSDQLSSRAARAASSVRFSVCVPGDLVMNKYQAHNGLFGAAIERGLITSNYSVFEPIGGVHSRFYSLLFATPLFRSEFFMRCQGVGDGMMPLYSGAFLKTPTVAPPISEQHQIADFVDQSTKAIAQTIDRLEREIGLLLEYRTRLVADVVTGRLDVREQADRLPDERSLDVVEYGAGLGDEAEAADEEPAA